MRFFLASSLALAIAIVISTVNVQAAGPQLRALDLIPNTVAIDRLAKYDQAGACQQTFLSVAWAHATQDLPDRLLLVIVNVKGTAADTWIHYGDGSATDVNMTFLGASSDSGLPSVSQMIFYLWDPPIGSFTVTATHTSLWPWIGESLGLYNVDKSLGIFLGTPVDTNGGGVTSQVSISTAMNQGDFLLGTIITRGSGGIGNPSYAAITSFTIQETAYVAYACASFNPSNFAELAVGTQPSSNTFTWEITDTGGNPLSDQDIIRLSPTFTESQQPPGGVPREIHPCDPMCRVQQLGNGTLNVLIAVNLWIWIFLAMLILGAAIIVRARKRIPQQKRPGANR